MALNVSMRLGAGQQVSQLPPSAHWPRLQLQRGRRRCASTPVAVAAQEQPTQQQEEAPQQQQEGPVEGHTPWYSRPVPGHQYLSNIATVEELAQAINSGAAEGKHVAIDFYAGNCPSCRAAYPKLCSIPRDAKLRAKYIFYKANCQDPGLLWWIKREGITSLPYFSIYDPNGNRVLGLTASFKRMPAIKEGLHTIANNPQASRFGLDPENKIVVLD